MEAAFPQATGPIAASDEAVDGDGWYLSSPADCDATVISYIVRAHDADEGNYDIDGPDLTTKGARARDVAASIHAAETTDSRVGQLAAIRAGDASPWSFLPPTPRQISRANNVRSRNEQEMTDIRRRENARNRIAQLEGAIERYTGIDDDGLVDAMKAEYAHTEVTMRVLGQRRRVSGWVEPWDDPKSPMAIIEYEDDFHKVCQDKAESIVRTRRELAGLNGKTADWPSAEDDAAKKAELDESTALYASFRGRPGGDIGPQRRNDDGTWYHLTPGETIHDDEFVDLTPR